MLVFLFADLLEAKQWALDTQKGRRNLDKWELGQIALSVSCAILPIACSPMPTAWAISLRVSMGWSAFGEFTESAPLPDLSPPAADWWIG